MGAPAEYFKAVFIRKRWTVLTPTGLAIVPVTQWIINHATPLPSDLRTASVWEAPWWLWVLSLMSCLCVAQILAWNEQFKTVRELTACPGVILNFHSNQFIVTNSNDHPAFNLEALPLSYGTRVYEFDKISALTSKQPQLLQSHDTDHPIIDIVHLWGKETNGKPLTLLFENNANPKRKWHSHNFLEPIGNGYSIYVRHICTAQVGSDGKCLHCRFKRPSWWQRWFAQARRFLESTTHEN